MSDCPTCASVYRRFIEFLSGCPAELGDIIFDRPDAGTLWYDAALFGWQVKVRQCKICRTNPFLRMLIEWCIRLEVPYSKIIEIAEHYDLFLNKPNVFSHRHKHLVDDLILVAVEPDPHGPGLLIPRQLLKQLRSFTIDNQAHVPRCSLGLGCEFLVHVSDDEHLCNYPGECFQTIEGGE